MSGAIAFYHNLYLEISAIVFMSANLTLPYLTLPCLACQCQCHLSQQQHFFTTKYKHLAVISARQYYLLHIEQVITYYISVFVEFSGIQ